jgi:hypothetical protein
MFHSTMSRRLATAAIAAPVTVALLAAPAAAGSSFYSRTTGKTARANWIQVDHDSTGKPIPRGANTVTGNVHVGNLAVYEISRGNPEVYGEIADFDCVPGFLPQGGGGHGFDEPEPDPNCTAVGFRFISRLILEKPGDGAVIDRKLGFASLNGRLELGGHAGVVGRPRIDTTWTGFGDVRREAFEYSYSEGGTTSTFSSISSIRNAAMGGTMGPMAWIQASCESPSALGCSAGTISNFKDVERSRTK